MDVWTTIMIGLAGVPAGVLMAMIASDLSAVGMDAGPHGFRRSNSNRLRKA